MSLADQTDVFFGPLSRANARVYVRVWDVTSDEGWSIAGTVRGPYCAGTRTLPATVPLKDLGGTPLLGICTLLDPCTWTPDLPASYRVQIELSRYGEPIEGFERTLGLRMLGTEGRNLRFEGERWVLRGITIDDAQPEQIALLHEQFAALVTSTKDEAVLAAASRQGVPLAVRIADWDLASVRGTLQQLARWPAVAFVIVEHSGLDVAALKQWAPNLQFGREVVESPFPAEASHSATQSAFTPAGDRLPTAWSDADFVVCPAEFLRHFQESANEVAVPMWAERRMDPALPIAEARAGCDRLQRDLAPLGDFAGYIV